MTHQQERLHRIPDACAALGIGRTYLYELMSDGRIRSVKVGRRRLVPESAIQEFIGQLGAEVA